MRQIDEEKKYYLQKLQQIKKKKTYSKIIYTLGALGTLTVIYQASSASFKVPFKQNMMKYYVPAIETLNEQNETSKPILTPSMQTLTGKENLKLLIEYNTPYEQQNDGTYKKIHYLYSYQNKAGEDIRKYLTNPETLNDNLTKEYEYVEYQNTINDLENNLTYKAQILNEDKSIYYYELQSKKDALLNTLSFSIYAGLIIGIFYALNKISEESLKNMQEQYEEYIDNMFPTLTRKK